MGLKDKLGKASKTTANHVEKTASNAIDSVAEKADSVYKKTSNTVSDGFDDLKADVKETQNKAKKKKASLFSRKEKTANQPKQKKATLKKTPTRSNKASPANKKPAAEGNTRIKVLIGVLSLLLLGLLAYGAMIFFNQGNTATSDSNTNVGSATTSPTTSPAPVANTTKSVTPNTENAALDNAANVGTETNLPSLSATEEADNPVLLPESIDEPLPTDSTLAAEELDQLQDERDQMTERENLIQEQIESLEQMEALKAQRIEILEKRLAELEANN